MEPAYFFNPEIANEVEAPETGMVRKVVYEDAEVRVAVLGFSAGHELPAHTTPMPATLYFLRGEGDLTLGSETRPVKMGAFAHMPPNINHAIRAKTPLIMLLLQMKGSRRE